jgi:hypothetical protein
MLWRRNSGENQPTHIDECRCAGGRVRHGTSSTCSTNTADDPVTDDDHTDNDHTDDHYTNHDHTGHARQSNDAAVRPCQRSGRCWLNNSCGNNSGAERGHATGDRHDTGHQYAGADTEYRREQAIDDVRSKQHKSHKPDRRRAFEYTRHAD